MNIVVMKFGGTSLSDPDKIRRAAERVARERRKGKAVAVVVSAPGEMTDELVDLAGRVSRSENPREMDQLLAVGEQVSGALLAMALRDRGIKAVSLTGLQAGIRARGPHSAAGVSSVRPRRILSELKAGRVAVVAGFQAVMENGDMATLGRGGSDLTAVALAAALNARVCEIFTDVKGVYTADPRLVSEARRISRIRTDDMLELAQAGAQVMQPQSIAYARDMRVSIHVRSAFDGREGTRIEVGRVEPCPGSVRALAIIRLGRLTSISAVGRHLDRGVALRMREVLNGGGVKCRRWSRTSGSLSCLVESSRGVSALRLLHRAFNLGRV
ncbi:MAG: aspartate kinase [Elusimicrobiota bacterium]